MKMSLKIRLLRQQSGFDQHQMAENLNISVKDYSRIENGLTILNDTDLRQLANIFGLTIQQFLSWEEWPVIS